MCTPLCIVKEGGYGERWEEGEGEGGGGGEGKGRGDVVLYMMVLVSSTLIENSSWWSYVLVHGT